MYGFSTEKSNKVIDILKLKFEPVFIYFADHIASENIFDIAYFSEEITDEYTVCLVENEIAEILGVPVEINNLKECNVEFAGELIADGEVVYCKNELEKRRFLNYIAHEFETIKIKRALLINRMNECESIYEQ